MSESALFHVSLSGEYLAPLSSIRKIVVRHCTPRNRALVFLLMM